MIEMLLKPNMDKEPAVEVNEENGIPYQRFNYIHINHYDYMRDAYNVRDIVLSNTEKHESENSWKRLLDSKAGTLITCHPTLVQCTDSYENNHPIEISMPPVGFLNFVTARDVTLNRNMYIVKSFGVLHDFRRQGIFKAMALKALDLCRGFYRNKASDGKLISKLQFHVLSTNYQAIYTLQSLNFTILPEYMVNCKTKAKLYCLALVKD
jgi:GNAT superfamily N-acetyltransferase